MDKSPRLLVENITMGYPAQPPLLENLSFSADPGELVTILAPNGSGKTTLLRAISGDLPLRGGRIFVDGTEVSSLSVRERARLLTRMPQEIPSADGLTGYDLVETAFFVRHGLFAHLTAAEQRTIRETADIFGILPLLDTELSRMSVGERQMFSLLRAAVQDTPVLLLDEPASALDFNNTERLFSLLHRLTRTGKTVLTVLHDPTEALRHSDTLVLLHPSVPHPFSVLSVQDTAALEPALRQVYPRLRLHTEPLFCYADPDPIP